MKEKKKVNAENEWSGDNEHCKQCCVKRLQKKKETISENFYYQEKK